jgi:hypothetical protein
MATATPLSSTDAYQGALEFERLSEERKVALVIEGGYSLQNAKGEDEPDWDSYLLKGVLIVSGHSIEDADKMAEGLTAEELRDKALPDVEYDPDDPVDAKAMSKLARRIWGITDPRPSGKVQRALPKGAVAIRTTVYRSKAKVKVAFVTSDHQIILDESLQPVIDQAIKEATKVHAQGTMIVDRVPELGTKVRKAITSGAKRASQTAALPELTEGS